MKIGKFYNSFFLLQTWIYVTFGNVHSREYSREIVGTVVCFSKENSINSNTNKKIPLKLNFFHVTSKTFKVDQMETQENEGTQKIVEKVIWNEELERPKKPKSIKVMDCGQDAFFYKSDGQYEWLGLADGVGASQHSDVVSWSLMNEFRKNVNSHNHFPMSRASNSIQIQDTESSGEDLEDGSNKGQENYTSKEGLSLKATLAKLFQNVTGIKDIPDGATTAVVMKFDRRNSILHALNLGDSRAIVIRDGKIGGTTISGTHRFNMPHQLSSKEFTKDDVKIGTTYDWGLEQTDIIIVASDGLFDNVHDDQILKIVSQDCSDRVGKTAKFGVNCLPHRDIESSLKRIAKDLLLETYRLSHDQQNFSPWCIEKHNFLYPPQENTKSSGFKVDKINFSPSRLICSGGKPDDTTIMVFAVFRPPTQNKV